MEELKLCPFCGGVAKIHKDDETGMYKIICTKCSAEVGRYWFSKTNDAVKAWNMRVS